MVEEPKKQPSFFARMFSEDPTASSQRAAGVLALIVGLIFAGFNIPSFKEVLYFSAVLFGIKEVRKGMEALGQKVTQTKPEVKPDTAPVLPAKATENTPA